MRFRDLGAKDRKRFEETLRETIAMAGLDERDGPTVIGVTSPRPQDGRTTLASGLAMTLARDFGGGVVLVDGHLEKPGIGELFGLDDGRGFGELLLGVLSLEQVERRIPGSELVVVSSGSLRVDTSRAVRSEGLFEAFGNLRLKYHYVVVDLPPVLESTAAAVIARRCDAVLLLAAHGRTSPAELTRANQLLRDSQVAGVVLNRYDPATPAFVRRAVGLAS